MIKRMILLFVLAAILSVSAFGRQKKHEDNTRILTLDTAADGTGDSIAVDSYPIMKTQAFHNRVWARIIFNDIVDTTGANGADFGKEDSIFAYLYAVYADVWTLIDAESTVYAMAAAGAAGTLTVKSDPNADSLFTEKLWLKVRLADTSSAQDSVFEIPYTYQIIHTFGD